MTNGIWLDIVVVPLSDRFGADDDRWLAQIDDLYVDLHRDSGAVRRHITPADGSKGAVESIVVALGSAGVFHALVACFRAWLDRDRTRSIEVLWRVGDREETVVLRGGGVDKNTFDEWAEAVGRRIGSGEWADSGTGHS